MDRNKLLNEAYSSDPYTSWDEKSLEFGYEEAKKDILDILTQHESYVEHNYGKNSHEEKIFENAELIIDLINKL